jgi:general nucleoside transport system ATP-binding protein
LKQALRNPQAEPLLRLRGVSKRFGELVANDDINLELYAGEILVILGENGAGKSTLMSILFGHYVADQGVIEVKNKRLPPGVPAAALAAGIGMVHQHFALADNLTVLENIVLGTQSLFSARLSDKLLRRKLAEMEQRFGLSVAADARVGDLSVGERQRVEILKALYRDARILILDEPTAVLTPQEAAALHSTMKRMAADGFAVIFISHKLDEVLDVGHRVLVLRAGRLVAEVFPRDVDRPTLASLMLGRRIDEPVRSAGNTGEVRVQIEGATVRGVSGRPRLSDLSLTIAVGEIMGIAGISGNGQGQLADLLGGLIRADEGRYHLDGEDVSNFNTRRLITRGVGRIPEDRHAGGLFGDMTTAETLIAEDYHSSRFSRFHILKWRTIKRFASEIIAKFSIGCESEACLRDCFRGVIFRRSFSAAC